MAANESTKNSDAAGLERESVQPRSVEVLILGTGVCGISAAVGLHRAGIDDFVVIERSDEIGGTWHRNIYPGCAVDIPSHLYSFSFAPNNKWSRVFAPQGEVKDYLVEVAEMFDIRRRIQFGVELLDASWIEGEQHWRIQTSSGIYLARSFVTAAGPLHEPAIPDLPGLSEFTGEMFHSTNWPEDLHLRGKKVVVLGTGASAVQFIPRIQPEVESLTVLQRTPSWVMPKPDWNVTGVEKALLRKFPILSKISRYVLWAPMDVFLLAATRHPKIARATGVVGKFHMRRFIKDPQLREDLTPSYAPTCKRLGLSNEYFRAMAKENVNLVTSAAASLGESSVTTSDGQTFEADVVIFGTGFQTIQHHPINSRIHGIGGRSLEETWQGSPRAYLGSSVAGFPNAFTMFGPNIGTLSGFVMAEAQTDYLVGAIKALRTNGLASLEVTQQAQDEFNDICDQKLKTSTFVLGGCSSYYLDDKHGRAPLVWPWSMAWMRIRLRKFDKGPYRAVPLADTGWGAIDTSEPVRGSATAAKR
ncbi:NAD(P)/FAD-dependent oxidoreductase [Arthrobacter sp. GMC3]|uniref:flavin-containing monooxygenase n=1 Tax=Arthrobacter sp. GMC3 TaxID=2058894 RepID=UPI0015E2AEE2|nr:NAD(P)/FAD-dependent oxidoreductase [Arthrobacter sp. GMC3]